jgi:hypothetical protein
MIRASLVRVVSVVCLLGLGIAPQRGKAQDAPVAEKPVRHSHKKGIGVYDAALAAGASKLNVAWYYNWWYTPTKGAPTDVEYVPMLFNWYPEKADETTKAILALKSQGARTILGYNEPDSKEMKLTPEDGLKPWPLLMRTGLRLGAPAGTHAEEPWMQTFMEGVRKNHYRVDFMTIHWYYLTDPQSFLGYLRKIHDLYHKPIWVTEFANVDWDRKPGQKSKFTPHDVAEFLRVVLPALDKLPYVERYAWFSAFDPEYADSTLFNKDGSLTEAGEVYAAE